jgi:hypothetical protein
LAVHGGSLTTSTAKTESLPPVRKILHFSNFVIANPTQNQSLEKNGIEFAAFPHPIQLKQ